MAELAGAEPVAQQGGTNVPRENFFHALNGRANFAIRSTTKARFKPIFSQISRRSKGNNQSVIEILMGLYYP